MKNFIKKMSKLNKLHFSKMKNFVIIQKFLKERKKEFLKIYNYEKKRRIA